MGAIVPISPLKLQNAVQDAPGLSLGIIFVNKPAMLLLVGMMQTIVSFALMSVRMLSWEMELVMMHVIMPIVLMMLEIVPLARMKNAHRDVHFL